jgi:hypothetical protein
MLPFWYKKYFFCSKYESSMRVIVKKILREYWEIQTDAEEQLKAWHKEVIKSN